MVLQIRKRGLIMKKEIADKIFNEAYQEYTKNIEENGVKKFTKYNGLDNLQTFSMMYTDIFLDSTRFMHRVFEKLMDSDDFKRELFNDMMNQTKDEAKRTQRNPFEI